MIYEKRKGYFKYVDEPCLEAIKWGSNDDPIGLLEIGKIYNGKIEVHSSYSAIFLEDFPNKKFNSISFEEIKEEQCS